MKSIITRLLAASCLIPLLLPLESRSAASLADAGDVGKVIDSQGIASVRAKFGQRWSQAGKGFVLQPGDWLRTDVRGANALAFKLSGGGRVTLGPGSLVEVVDAGTIAFNCGEIEIAADTGGEIAVQAIGGKGYAASGGERLVLRRRDAGVARGVEVLEREPSWLQGFKGTITSESMGSLLANVDGRNTPLTLGFHKVSVDIRDGTARTVIEESFVNHTPGRLEGTFYFPLPQEASISGFGMWIGGELVEADVVEKQRAREIYETILRERRDPGLLEWTGGNLFKARVFPIEPHAEKRIKISYTEVLPMRHGKLRYSYGLQSEMLQQTPLRELSINVRVSSALPIKGFTCTSHDARLSAGAHSAQAEFVAQEFTPSSDFEVEIEVDAGSSPVVMIPHRRGDDGYFMALVTPPGDDGAWEREFIPDGAPMHLVILADTSGSMNASARANQDALIAGLLGSLGAADSFDIATCDSEVRWFVRDASRSGEAEVTLARDFVADRHSLGWTDLDRAFAAALGMEPKPNSHVIYIGDGVLTTGDADPVAFANRLRRLHAGEAGAATCHAIAPTGSYEPAVLKAIASLGGGSVRRVGGSDTPGVTAQRLLAEIAQPGMRDLQIEFNGIRAARVYPQELPNLPAGSQQVIIGRYLPEGGEQRGEVIVTGTRDGKGSRFSSPVSLADAEQGNSFIPRLWARLYLDDLLEQGRTQEIQDEIIALSEEYKIMTPFTSFLVLESDADRERFKVTPRFQMRDGERFFADGRGRAEYELLQQQMRLAGAWRLNLRRQVLQDFRGLGRGMIAALPQAAPFGFSREGGRFNVSMPVSGVSMPVGSTTSTRAWGGHGYFGKDQLLGLKAGIRSESESLHAMDFDADGFSDLSQFSYAGGLSGLDAELDFERGGSWEELGSPAGDGAVDELWAYDGEEGDLADLSVLSAPSAEPASEAGGYLGKRRQDFRGGRDAAKKEANYLLGWASEKQLGNRRSIGGRLAQGDYWYWPDHVGDLISMFPPVAAAGRSLPERDGSDAHPWPAEAIAVADRLLRLGAIAALRDGGIAITQQSESDAAKSQVEALLSGAAWFVRADGDRQSGDVQWWQEQGTRGHYFDALGLGRERAADLKADRFAFPLDLGDHSLESLADGLRHLDVAEMRAGDGHRVTLRLSAKQSPGTVHEYLIDTARNVVLKSTSRDQGKVTGTVEYADFVELAGSWWARLVEHKDAGGKVVNRTRRTFEQLDPQAFGAAFSKSLAPREGILIIHEPLPSVAAAKQAAADGKANFDSELALLGHFAQSQQWDRSAEHFEALRRLAGDRRGLRFLDLRFQSMQRRNEQARELAFAAARELASRPAEHEFYLVQHLNSEAQRVTNPNERYDFLVLVEAVYARAPEYLAAMRDWRQQMVYALQRINRRPEALAMLKGLAEEFPGDVNLQTQYANELANTGEIEAALGLLDGVLTKRENLQPWEISSLRSSYLNLLEGQSRVEDVLEVVGRWLDGPGIDDGQSNWVRRRYLSALIRTGEVDKAYALIEAWITAATELDGAAFDAAAQSRAWAAVETLCGSAYNVYPNDIDERFHAPLAKLIRKFALDAEHHRFATRPMQDYRFARTEAARKLRAHFAGVLAKRAKKLGLAEINRLYAWISGNDPAIDRPVWESIASDLIARWEKLEGRGARDAFAGPIISLTSGQLGADAHLAFLRRQLGESAQDLRGHYASQLCDAILGQPHSPGLEDEAFSLLYELGSHFPAKLEHRHDAILAVQAAALNRLDDWILRSGFEVAWASMEKKEELPRTELAGKRGELIKAVRSALVARLGKELDAARGADLADWLTIERLSVEVALGRDPQAIAAECWEFLGAHDPLAKADAAARPMHELVLIARHVATLEHLAARSSADPALAARLLAWFDRGIAADAEGDGGDGGEAWRWHKYQLLVALDRPQDLKAALQGWIKPGDANHGWRVTLGYLHAELNEIGDAVRLFEAVEKADELGPREYRTLADWYLVLDQKQDRDRAMLGFYQSMEEWQLANLIQQHSSRIQNGFDNGTPEDFDPAIVDMFRAIFKKSPNPQNHLYQLGSLYRCTKDFRLLECVPEGILGNSAQQIYPFLSTLQQVLQYVSDEATTDQLLAHLAKVRGRAETAVDQRGLDLLELQVRRKAAEVLNQPGQHVPLALAAMQRAFKLEWGSGERRLMADFLASLGQISQPPLAEEQLRQLAALFDAETGGTPDRLHIAVRWSATVRQYGGAGIGNAVTILESALDEFVDAHGGILSTDAQEAFDQLVGFFEGDRSFARGERRILAALGGDVSVLVHDWLVVRKFLLYTNAVSAGAASVSLGSGAELYQNAQRALIAELKTGRHNFRYQLCQQLINLYRAAHLNAKIAAAKSDIVAFGLGAFDELVPFSTQNYQSLVQSLADSTRQLAGDLAALEFLIVRYEREPSSFHAAGQGGWQSYGYYLARYRAEAKQIGQLEPRLLKIVLAELRRDLESQQQVQRTIYHDNHSYFWAEKRADFQRLAEQVAAERKGSIVALKHIADYLFHGLDAHQLAIDLLVAAHQRGIQDEAGTSQLAGFYEARNRFGEAVAYLAEIVAINPDQPDYRRRLVRALGRSDQRAEAIAALDAAISHFKGNKNWNEDPISSLALGSYEGNLWARGVDLYDELVPLHQRTQPNRGIGNGTLSNYYANLSFCHAQLGDTGRAVEAAAGAIVSWGPTNTNRAQALRSLVGVLEAAKDLDAYVAELDASVEASGLENPIVRKALGEVFSRRQQFSPAIRQLQLAAAAEPGDPETNRLLVAAYDALGDHEAAIGQLLASVALAPREIAALKDLAERYKKLGNPAEAERARTSLVEALPNESEGHSMLAEIRQTQGRWSDAAAHWAEVAKIRRLEPTGLQRLAEAQIKLGSTEAATLTLEKLLAKDWPSRFGDVHDEARRKLAALENSKKVSS